VRQPYCSIIVNAHKANGCIIPEKLTSVTRNGNNKWLQ